MNELTKSKVDLLLSTYNEKIEENLSVESIEKALNDLLRDNFEPKSILGFDIYRYSQYPVLQQTLIPYIFKWLYNMTIDHCLKLEPFFFQFKTRKDFEEYFIDSGDGGFQIFDNPFQAIIFAIYFQANIKRYNTGKIKASALYKIVGELTLRYALTYDVTYCFSKNYYGPSIINNARLMGKDRLNRFLSDENTMTWFNKEFNGLENLQLLDEVDFKKMKLFENFKKVDAARQTLLFNAKKGKIANVDILKIGEIKSKLNILSVYSLHIQARMYSPGMNEVSKYTITLGNLNSSGISE